MDNSEKREQIDSRALKDARDWIVRLSSGGTSDAELARFKAWRNASVENAEAFARERLFWRQLDALDPQGEGGWRRHESRSWLNRRGFLLGGGAAAVAAGIAIIAAPRLTLLWEEDYRTAPGEQANVSLPDGSRVTLNTDSALALRFRPDLRLVELLQGEAMFDVRPDRDTPFRVAALSGNTETFGSSFAIQLIDNGARVMTEDGEVSVFGPAAPDGPLSPAAIKVRKDQETSYIRGGLPMDATSVNLDQALAWRSGRVIFDSRPFVEALAELGRYIPERIVLTNRSRDKDPVSAVFSIRQAASAIEALAQTQGLTARRIPGVMILVS